MHVLIIEDEQKMAGLLRKGLEEENHTVTIANDGRTGLEMAQLLDCDAIVLDLMLPGIDGYEIARRLRTEPTLQPRKQLRRLSPFPRQGVVGVV